MIAWYDRVHQTSTTSGTGSLTLSATLPLNKRPWSLIGVGNFSYGFASSQTADNLWEINTFTLQSNGTLARGATPLASSNAGALVNFDGSTLDVMIDIPASLVAALALTNQSNVFTQHNAIGASASVDPTLLTGKSLADLAVVDTVTAASSTAVLHNAVVANLDLNFSSQPTSNDGCVGIQLNVLWDASSGYGSNTAVVGNFTNVYNLSSKDLNDVQGFRTAVGMLGSGGVNDGRGTDSEVINFGSGVMNIARGVYSSVSSPGSGSIGIGYGLHVETPSGTINNCYGVFVEDQSHATSSGDNFNVYSKDDTGNTKNYFGGVVTIGTKTPSASAFLQVDSTAKGFLLPRMTTTQKNAISSPAEGLEVYDTTLHALCVYNGTAWKTVTVS